MPSTERQRAIEETDAHRCRNCRDLTPLGQECWNCGHNGHCHICQEPTQLTTSPDLNYCSEECAREGEFERRFTA